MSPRLGRWIYEERDGVGETDLFKNVLEAKIIPLNKGDVHSYFKIIL